MPANRYFCAAELNVGDEVAIVGAEFHHLIHVMRASVGESVEIVNGRGTLAFAQIVGIEKKKHALALVDRNEKEQESKRCLVIAQAIPRQGRLDTIVEKTCELGVDELILFPGERSERKDVGSKALGRLETVAISAMKQCGRLFVPKISVAPSLKKWDSLSTLAFFGDLAKEAPTLASQITGDQSITFFVGPESGFTPEEEKQLKVLGVKGVKLHENVLRTETASIVAAAIISHLFCE